MAIVTWIKSTTDTWLPFEIVDLSNVATTGVYLIWHAGQPGRVVRLGQGKIAERLLAHRDDTEVTNYRTFGTLYVTWAEVPARLIDGVERYLAEYWKPLIGDRYPNAPPIEVNSPFPT